VISNGAVSRLSREEKGGFDSGAPTDFYTKEEAEKAIQCAEEILTKEEFDALLERSPGWYKAIAMGTEITSQRKGGS
jgi:hypothetical protein